MKTYKQLIYGLCLVTAIGCNNGVENYRIETTRGSHHVRVWNGSLGKGIALEDSISAVAGHFNGEDITTIYFQGVHAGDQLEKYANPDSLRKIYNEIAPK